ncbi:DUF721 domain-containing protein [Verrucomicrobiaceae bacterium N1E253]|uniref:DUF721 domain-containing protein n=1 Tax=Oceaniferula marina TaxID=2748318 RepID=A0A851GGD8_9BACT|nr:DUF721 domain-containing protein [Oceaniferula marina]NWK54325.1 DUF721 domain-containing protein [Oceaniferula marina]
MGNNSHRIPGSRGKGRKRASSHIRRVRHSLLTQWRGGVDPPAPDRNIHRADEFLSDLLKSVGLSEGIDESRLKESWSKVAGEFVAKHTVPESIRNGVLVLLVLQPTMKFHLQQMSAQLLENMRQELGSGVVKRIIFKIG